MADDLAVRLAAFEKETGERPNARAKDILLRRLYESAYGIFNHYDPSASPLALVSARQKDELFLYSKTARDMERFIEAGVYQATGTSYDQWMGLPVPEAELMLELTARKNRGDSVTVGQMEKKLKEALEQK